MPEPLYTQLLLPPTIGPFWEGKCHQKRRALPRGAKLVWPAASHVVVHSTWLNIALPPGSWGPVRRGDHTVS